MKTVGDRMAELVFRHGVLMGGGIYEDVTKQLGQQESEWKQALTEQASRHAKEMKDAVKEALEKREAEDSWVRVGYHNSIVKGLEDACARHKFDADKLSDALTKAEKHYEGRINSHKAELEARVALERESGNIHIQNLKGDLEHFKGRLSIETGKLQKAIDDLEEYRRGDAQRIEAARQEAYRNAVQCVKEVAIRLPVGSERNVLLKTIGDIRYLAKEDAKASSPVSEEKMLGCGSEDCTGCLHPHCKRPRKRCGPFLGHVISLEPHEHNNEFVCLAVAWRPW